MNLHYPELFFDALSPEQFFLVFSPEDFYAFLQAVMLVFHEREILPTLKHNGHSAEIDRISYCQARAMFSFHLYEYGLLSAVVEVSFASHELISYLYQLRDQLNRLEVTYNEDCLLEDINMVINIYPKTYISLYRTYFALFRKLSTCIIFDEAESVFYMMCL